MKASQEKKKKNCSQLKTNPILMSHQIQKITQQYVFNLCLKERTIKK